MERLMLTYLADLNLFGV